MRKISVLKLSLREVAIWNKIVRWQRCSQSTSMRMLTENRLRRQILGAEACLDGGGCQFQNSLSFYALEVRIAD